MLNKIRNLRQAYALFSGLLSLVGQLGVSLNGKQFADSFTLQVCRKTNCARLSWQEGEKTRTVKLQLTQE